jgi:hypothetical protein
MPGEYEVETMGGEFLDAGGGVMTDSDDKTFNVNDYLSPDEQRLQENLGTAFRDYAEPQGASLGSDDDTFNIGDYLTPDQQRLQENLGTAYRDSAGRTEADPSGIDWWDRSFDATIGGLGRLAQSPVGGQLARMLGAPDPAPVSRPQQVFTRAPASGSPVPAKQFSLWPARWDGGGQPGVMRTNYQPVGDWSKEVREVANSDPAKIIAYAVAAGIGVWLLKKLVL